MAAAGRTYLFYQLVGAALFLTPRRLGRCLATVVIQLFSSEVVRCSLRHTSLEVDLPELVEMVVARMPPPPLVDSYKFVQPRPPLLVTCPFANVYSILPTERRNDAQEVRMCSNSVCVDLC